MYLYWQELIETKSKPEIQDGQRVINITDMFVVKIIPLSDIKFINPSYDGKNIVYLTDDTQITIDNCQMLFGDPTQQDFEQWEKNSENDYDSGFGYHVHHKETYCTDETSIIKDNQHKCRFCFHWIWTEVCNENVPYPCKEPLTQQEMDKLKSLILEKCEEELGRPVEGNLEIKYDPSNKCIYPDYDDEFFVSIGELL